MIQQLHTAWRARRVLLVGHTDRATLFMQALLDELGAKTARIAPTGDPQILNRALTQGRICALIIPSTRPLIRNRADQSLRTLSVLLDEAREAGVPLTILMSDENVYRACGQPWHAQETDPIGGETPAGLTQSLLDLYAQGVSRGLCGDPVSTLCIRHPPCLGCGHSCIEPYNAWCRAALLDQIIEVPNPGMQGIFLHPLDVCCGALLLGARFFLGDAGCTGAFNLGAGIENLVPNRTAALRFTRRLGITRPIRESEPAHAAVPPLHDSGKAKFLCGTRCIVSGEEALAQLFSLQKAAENGFESLQQEIAAQTQAYLARLAAQ